MSEAFNASFKHVILSEGAYVNHPNDPGGETAYGISKRSYPDLDISKITADDAKSIYYSDYWKALNCDYYKDEVAFQLFDAAVNHGRGNAIRMMQRSVGVADDGIIGPITRKAIASHPSDKLVMKFLAERIDFWCRLSTFATFGKGWMRRAAMNLRIGAEV